MPSKWLMGLIKKSRIAEVQIMEAKLASRYEKVLISSAYLPPLEYISLIYSAEEAIIEKEENYLKQSYRNRCYILSSHGPQFLTVPVYMGSLHKTAIKDIRIDYSKRWQPVHIGALVAAYNSSPYFEFYFENIEKIITRRTEYLLDLNAGLLEAILGMINIKANVVFSDHFEPVGGGNDFRYSISPKKQVQFPLKDYPHVFTCPGGVTARLSVLDLIFNMGPDSAGYLRIS
jgi:hypothetical protein